MLLVSIHATSSGTNDNGKQVVEAEGFKNAGPLKDENIEDDSVQPIVRPLGTLLGIANNILQARRYTNTEVQVAVGDSTNKVCIDVTNREFRNKKICPRFLW